MDEAIRKAASAISGASALLVTAGAGMGVDSGLPDFRGNEGFWRAYPPYAKLGLSFAELANPRWFRTDPAFAWGFYGHRLNLYRTTVPHGGFAILKRWMETRSGFVFTSNVDGQFQRAGFDADRVHECHGAIDWLQCTRGCTGLFSAGGFEVKVDPETFRAEGPLPACPTCGALARPNVLMFGDGEWDAARSDEQEIRFGAWLHELERKGHALAVVECGAGTAIPTVRMTSERVARTLRGTLIRINVREPEGGTVGVPMGALSALTAISQIVDSP
jgi:NAD-dependent SIR2 family protein deacetylase